MLTQIELFAGAGGLALGLEQAGLTGVCHVEWDHAACETLRKNRPWWNIIEGDVHDVDFTEYLGKVDVVTGGAPCQAFSYAGKKLGFEDTRGTLFHEFARCVKEVCPKMFLFENVRGLLSHDQGRTFETIRGVFEDLGYQIQHKTLNACFYGVGQKRERVIVIGIRNDLAEVIHFNYPEPDKEWTTLRQALEGVPESEGEKYSKRKYDVMKRVPPGGSWVDLPDDVARNYMGKSYFSGGGRRGMARRISWDEPCLTLTTSPSQKQTERCHPEETRPFTVREYARIQSFPDDWIFTGTMHEQYKQIGNAVPVEMARRVGVQIVEALRGENSVSWSIDFIKEDEFEELIREQIAAYGDSLKAYDVAKFNKNIIDPVKMLFDKTIYGNSWETQIAAEIFRQRDKSNNNGIGYFHQRIFRYIKNCRVPDNGKEGGWDVIVECPEGYRIDENNVVHRIYAEVKNKHNTMSGPTQKALYEKMKRQILEDDDSCCMWVQVIAKQHKNDIWTLNRANNRRIREISIDEFMAICTGEPDAFHQVCMALPEHIEKVLSDGKEVTRPSDVVMDELMESVEVTHARNNRDTAMLMAMYALAFKSYNGFKDDTKD